MLKENNTYQPRKHQNNNKKNIEKKKQRKHM